MPAGFDSRLVSLLVAIMLGKYGARISVLANLPHFHLLREGPQCHIHLTLETQKSLE